MIKYLGGLSLHFNQLLSSLEGCPKVNHKSQVILKGFCVVIIDNIQRTMQYMRVNMPAIKNSSILTSGKSKTLNPSFKATEIDPFSLAIMWTCSDKIMSIKDILNLKPATVLIHHKDQYCSTTLEQRIESCKRFGDIEMEITLRPGTTSGQKLDKIYNGIYKEFLLPKGQKFKVKNVKCTRLKWPVLTVFVETIK